MLWWRHQWQWSIVCNCVLVLKMNFIRISCDLYLISIFLFTYRQSLKPNSKFQFNCVATLFFTHNLLLFKLLLNILNQFMLFKFEFVICTAFFHFCMYECVQLFCHVVLCKCCIKFICMYFSVLLCFTCLYIC